MDMKTALKIEKAIYEALLELGEMSEPIKISMQQIGKEFDIEIATRITLKDKP